jgi:hypothetical protein
MGGWGVGEGSTLENEISAQVEQLRESSKYGGVLHRNCCSLSCGIQHHCQASHGYIVGLGTAASKSVGVSIAASYSVGFSTTARDRMAIL